jgi:hypothetical protein
VLGVNIPDFAPDLFQPFLRFYSPSLRCRTAEAPPLKFQPFLRFYPTDPKQIDVLLSKIKDFEVSTLLEILLQLDHLLKRVCGYRLVSTLLEILPSSGRSA